LGNITDCGTYTGTPPSGNMVLPCIIIKDTTLISNFAVPPGISMTIDSGAVLTIDPEVILTIDSGESITIKDGSGVLIKSGGVLQIDN